MNQAPTLECMFVVFFSDEVGIRQRKESVTVGKTKWVSAVPSERTWSDTESLLVRHTETLREQPETDVTWSV